VRCAAEIIYVPDRTLDCDVEGIGPRTYRAGDALTVPAGAVHSVRNLASDAAAELVTYFVEKGKPFIVLVDWPGGRSPVRVVAAFCACNP
jgi:quercetin dioxygenase-like cupin family protein